MMISWSDRNQEFCVAAVTSHLLLPLCVCVCMCVSVQQEHWFEKALREKKGFVIKKMKEDGACLFRAVGESHINHMHAHTSSSSRHQQVAVLFRVPVSVIM